MERRHYSGPECRALNTPQPNLVQLDPIICEIDPYVKYMQSNPDLPAGGLHSTCFWLASPCRPGHWRTRTAGPGKSCAPSMWILSEGSPQSPVLPKVLAISPDAAESTVVSRHLEGIQMVHWSLLFRSCICGAAMWEKQL